VDKKHIQQMRMMNYFLEASCNIIKKDGIKELTVRKVADLAGYHYSTIYNYFRDLNDLIVQTTARFFDMSLEYIKTYASDSENELDYYIKAWEGFCNFSLENPNIFRCMFIEDFGDSAKSDMKKEMENISLFKNKRETIEKCIVKGYLPAEKIFAIEEMLISICVGRVLMFINNRSDCTKEELLKSFKENLIFILKNF